MEYEDFDEEAFKRKLIEGGISAESAAATATLTAAGRRNGAPKNIRMPIEEAPAADPLGLIDAARNRGQAEQQATDLFETPAAPAESVPTKAVGQGTPEEKSKPKPAKAKRFMRPLKTDLTNRQKNLIEDALAIEQEEARAAGAVGYMVRTLAQATLPHLDPKLPNGMLYSRDTGQLILTVAPTSPKYGIPYGSIPRLIIAWLCTEIVHNKDQIQQGEYTVSLGKSQADFLDKLQMHNNGNDIRRFRDQSLRLFKSVISAEYTNDENGDHSTRLMISDRSSVFWHPKKADQRSLWDSTLDLSKSFCDEVLQAPVPIDMRVFHALSKSPMAMDIYTWFTYRMFILVRSGRPQTLIPWSGLQQQIGSRYGENLTKIEDREQARRQAMYSFKSNFKARLREVLSFYPEALDHVEDTGNNLRLTPCQLHLPHYKAIKR